jgi:hypothetical protein
MLCAYDASPRPLYAESPRRPRLIERIRHAVVDPSRAYLTVFKLDALERKLSVLLGVPLNGLDPSLAHLDRNRAAAASSRKRASRCLSASKTSSLPKKRLKRSAS